MPFISVKPQNLNPLEPAQSTRSLFKKWADVLAKYWNNTAMTIHLKRQLTHLQTNVQTCTCLFRMQSNPDHLNTNQPVLRQSPCSVSGIGSRISIHIPYLTVWASKMPNISILQKKEARVQRVEGTCRLVRFRPRPWDSERDSFPCFVRCLHNLYFRLTLSKRSISMFCTTGVLMKAQGWRPSCQVGRALVCLVFHAPASQKEEYQTDPYDPGLALGSKKD